jgi:hypothetical protein
MIENFNNIFNLVILFFMFVTSAYATDKHYGSKYDKEKTDQCHAFVEALIPNGAERVKKVIQTLY